MSRLLAAGPPPLVTRERENCWRQCFLGSLVKSAPKRAFTPPSTERMAQPKKPLCHADFEPYSLRGALLFSPERPRCLCYLAAAMYVFFFFWSPFDSLSEIGPDERKMRKGGGLESSYDEQGMRSLSFRNEKGRAGRNESANIEMVERLRKRERVKRRE